MSQQIMIPCISISVHRRFLRFSKSKFSCSIITYFNNWSLFLHVFADPHAKKHRQIIWLFIFITFFQISF